MKFFKEGHNWATPKAFLLKARRASEITTYEDWHRWMFQPQDQLDDFWAIHEAWLRTGFVARRIGVTARTKMIGFMLTFLEYDQVKRNQAKVGFLLINLP